MKTDERLTKTRAMIESKKGAYGHDLSMAGRDAWLMAVAADALMADLDAALARLAEAETARTLDREAAAKWLYARIVVRERRSGGTWETCPSTFQENWREEADDLLAVLVSEPAAEETR